MGKPNTWHEALGRADRLLRFARTELDRLQPCQERDDFRYAIAGLLILIRSEVEPLNSFSRGFKEPWNSSYKTFVPRWQALSDVRNAAYHEGFVMGDVRCWLLNTFHSEREL